MNMGDGRASVKTNSGRRICMGTTVPVVHGSGRGEETGCRLFVNGKSGSGVTGSVLLSI